MEEFEGSLLFLQPDRGSEGKSERGHPSHLGIGPFGQDRSRVLQESTEMVSHRHRPRHLVFDHVVAAKHSARTQILIDARSYVISILTVSEAMIPTTHGREYVGRHATTNVSPMSARWLQKRSIVGRVTTEDLRETGMPNAMIITM